MLSRMSLRNQPNQHRPAGAKNMGSVNVILILSLSVPVFALAQTPVLLPYPPPPELHLPEPELRFNTTNAVYRGILLYASGASHGLAETLTWRYNRFQRVHPKALEGYWNPRVSWVNKYKTDRHGNIIPPRRPAYFGSTTFLVWTTDGYHAASTGARVFGAAGLTIPVWQGSRKKLKHYALELAGSCLVWTAGFHTTYTLIYR